MQLTHIIAIFTIVVCTGATNDLEHFLYIRSGHSALDSGSLVARQMTCDVGFFECAGTEVCCPDGATCAVLEGQNICQSSEPCIAPPVPCGVACCNAGVACVTEGTQYVCQPTGGTLVPTVPAPTSAPTPAPPPTGVPKNSTTTKFSVPLAPSPATFSTNSTTKKFTSAATSAGVATPTLHPLSTSLASKDRLSIVLGLIAAVIGIGFTVLRH